MGEIFVHSPNAECLNEPLDIQVLILVTVVVVRLQRFVLVSNWVFQTMSDRPLAFFVVVVVIIIHQLVVQVVFAVDEGMYTKRHDMWAVVEEEYHTVEKVDEVP